MIAPSARRLAARMNRLTTEADAQLTRSRGISAMATPAAAAADAQGAPAAGGRERATGAGRRCAD